MNKSLFSLLLILHVFFLPSSMARPTPRKLDSSSGWITIPNASEDPAAKAYGSYAVSEYNKNTAAYLEFIKVVKGFFMITNLVNPTSFEIQTKVILWVEAKNCTDPDQFDIYETHVSDNCVYPLPPIPGPLYCYKTLDYFTKSG